MVKNSRKSTFCHDSWYTLSPPHFCLAKVTTQIFDEFGDQEEYGHIEQDSTRVHDPKKKEKKNRKSSRNTFQAGATVDAKNYSVKTTYLL